LESESNIDCDDDSDSDYSPDLESDVDDDYEEEKQKKTKRVRKTKASHVRAPPLPSYDEWIKSREHMRPTDIFDHEYYNTVNEMARKYEEDQELINWFLNVMPTDICSIGEKQALLHIAYDITLRFLRLQKKLYHKDEWYENQYWLKAFITMKTEVLPYPTTPKEMAYVQKYKRHDQFQNISHNHSVVTLTGELQTRHFARAYSWETEQATTYEILKLEENESGDLDPYRYTRTGAYQNDSSSVHHIGIWSSQGNHNGPDMKCTLRQLAYLKCKAVQKMEHVRSTMIQCTMPYFYNELMELKHRYPQHLHEEKRFNGELIDLQLVPTTALNINYLCGIHNDGRDCGHCFITKLGTISENEGGTGVADLMIVYNGNSGSLTQLNSRKLRHWVEDMTKAINFRISQVSFVHNSTMHHYNSEEKLKNIHWNLNANNSSISREAHKHVIGRIKYKNKYATQEKKFLEMINNDLNLFDLSEYQE
jgi:hypothetical protein